MSRESGRDAWADFAAGRASASLPWSRHPVSLSWGDLSGRSASATDSAGLSTAPLALHGSGPETPEYRSVLERLIWDGTNSARARERLPPLAESPVHGAVAYRHSRDMALRSFFDHTNPDGKRPADRAREAGLDQLVGENIIMLDTAAPLLASPRDMKNLVARLLRGWMDSPGHRDNILHRGYLGLGVGVYVTVDDIWATQLFAC